jgi:hypothetical protein
MGPMECHHAPVMTPPPGAARDNSSLKGLIACRHIFRV